jgi:hypothetical protein
LFFNRLGRKKSDKDAASSSAATDGSDKPPV